MKINFSFVGNYAKLTAKLQLFTGVFMFKILLMPLLAIVLGCSHAAVYKSSLEITRSNDFGSGKLVIVQGPTSSTEANINVLAPRLKNYVYEVVDSGGQKYKAEVYETVKQEPLHWKVDKILVSGLKPGVKYVLSVVDVFRGSSTVVDKRTFQALNTSASSVRFAYASCMADDYRFNAVIGPMWARMKSLNPDMIILNGDLVYVDSFEFVERQKATELDIWMRFIDSFNRLPIYHWDELKPIFATWDDHDFGTNDSDREFVSKEGARRVFLAFFGGKNLDGVYKLEHETVYFAMNAFQQKFYFMDDRYFRQPNKNQTVAEKYAQWGEKQHKWLIDGLKTDNVPAWIINGNQVSSGVDLSYKESLQWNDPEHYKLLQADLKGVATPFVFASGDIHFSEIMALPADRFGLDTYEVTSSSMHSYVGEGWKNPLRVPKMFTNEFNFMMINSQNKNGKLAVDVESWGLKDEPYFKYQFEVKR